MNSKKVVLIVLMILAIVMSITNFVYADSCDITISTNKKTNYAKGEKVVLTVLLDDISSENGICQLEGILEYDEEIFEKINVDDEGNTDQITSLDDWKDVTFDSETNKFTLRTTAPAKEAQKIMKISLKLKENVEADSSIIMLNNLVASNGQDDIKISTATTTIKIGEPEEDDTIPSITTTPTPKTSPSAKTTSTPKATQTPSSDTMPQTGIKDNVAPIIFGALIVSLVTYIAYRRYKEI